jgi:hypothetical protein
LSEILTSRVNAKIIFLDDKKCQNTKSCIEHLIRQVYSAFSVQYKKKEEKKNMDEAPKKMIN